METVTGWASASTLAPIVAIIISLATFVLTQLRSQQLDERTAARDTVQILATQNEALQREVDHLETQNEGLGRQLDDLRVRMRELEQRCVDCEAKLLKSVSDWL